MVSILLAISSFFGFNKAHDISTTISSPTTIPTDIIFEEASLTPEPTVILTITAKPTITKPKTSINEDILKKFFGISDINRANLILKNPDELKKYEQEYYQKFLTYPIPRITIINNTQLIGMPSKDGVKICNGGQLKKLYDEITLIEKQAYFEKMDYDCHHNSRMQETAECQEWRRINDVNRVQPTKGSIDDEIAALQKKISEYANKKNVYDDLLIKNCKN